jgi:hypothetical protein
MLETGPVTAIEGRIKLEVRPASGLIGCNRNKVAVSLEDQTKGNPQPKLPYNRIVDGDNPSATSAGESSWKVELT